eukprot:1086568-Rhodomonas_salina.1
MRSVWTLKKLQNRYSWLHGEYVSWYLDVDSLCKKLSGTDCVEVQTYLDNPPKQMELFYSYNMNNKPSIRPQFLLSVANAEEMVARERSVMLPQTERVQEEDKHTDDFLHDSGGEGELVGGVAVNAADVQIVPDDDSGRATPDSQRSDTYPAGVGRAASMQRDLASVPQHPPAPDLAQVPPQLPVSAVEPLPVVLTAVPVPPVHRLEERRQASAAQQSSAELGA